jgi:hypothetical protein
MMEHVRQLAAQFWLDSANAAAGATNIVEVLFFVLLAVFLASRIAGMAGRHRHG